MADLLQEFIDKYRAKGFEISQKRKLKLGIRIFLKKERKSFWGGFNGIYVYYYDGKATIDSMIECFKDYQNFYEDTEFDTGDFGFYLCSEIDKKLFSRLKRIKIDESEVRNSLKPHVLTRLIRKDTEEIPFEKPKKSQNVFIVHGRDKEPAFELERLLEREFGLKSVLLQDQPHGGKTIIEKLEKYSDVDYAFVILTPDDVGGLRGEKLDNRTRQNVVLEWGLLVAKIGREKISVLLKGDVDLPSDMRGVGYYRFYDSVEEKFLKIKKELRNAKIIK